MGGWGHRAGCVSQPPAVLLTHSLVGVSGGAWMPRPSRPLRARASPSPAASAFPMSCGRPSCMASGTSIAPIRKTTLRWSSKSRTQVVHESFQGRSRLLRRPGPAQLHPPAQQPKPELGGKYYSRGPGGLQPVHLLRAQRLDIISESRGLCLSEETWERGSPPSALLGDLVAKNQDLLVWLEGGAFPRPT